MTGERREYNRRWKELNRKWINAQARKRRKENPEKYRESRRVWREQNRERVNARQAVRARLRRKENPEKVRGYHRAWRELNRDRVNAKVRILRKENPEKYRKYQRVWDERNRERENARKWTRRKILQKENPEKYRAMSRKAMRKQRERADVRILQNLRRRIHAAIRGNTKSARTVELLGCPVVRLKAHLESLFKPGITWENYGPVWHIDHIKPCASFDLTNPEQQRICFHWSNLQPLFAAENMRKGAKLRRN